MARNPLIERIGIIIGYYVQTDDGTKYRLPIRATDDDGYPEVLIDARAVGGHGNITRQPIKPYIGMKCEFIGNNLGYGFNFKIIKE